MNGVDIARRCGSVSSMTTQLLAGDRRIGDVLLVDDEEHTVHAVHNATTFHSAPTVAIHFTDGTAILRRVNQMVDVVSVAPATDADFDGLV